jgi:hypothetical protein
LKNEKLSLNPVRLVRALGFAVFGLILLSLLSVSADNLAGNDSVILHKLKKLFYVDFELNIPAFFSSLILLLASLILTTIAILKKKQKDSFSMEWMILAIGFVTMAFDELIAVHERMIEPVREVLGNENLGIFYFAWVIPMGVLVLLLAILFFRFWWSLPVKTKIYFLVAGFIYLGGAIGFELIESRYCEIYGKDNITYIILTTIEEGLEMTGVIIFIKGLLNYLTETFGEVQLQLDNPLSENKSLAVNRVEKLKSY